MQTRHSSQPLVRIDIDDNLIHTNPDGKIIKGSHVHLPIEGYGIAYAFPLKSDEGIMVAGSSDYVPSIFEAFRLFCHIDNQLNVRWGLGI